MKVKARKKLHKSVRVSKQFLVYQKGLLASLAKAAGFPNFLVSLKTGGIV